MTKKKIREREEFDESIRKKLGAEMDSIVSQMMTSKLLPANRTMTGTEKANPGRLTLKT